MQPCVTGYRRFATTHGLWFVRGLPIGYPPIEDTLPNVTKAPRCAKARSSGRTTSSCRTVAHAASETGAGRAQPSGLCQPELADSKLRRCPTFAGTRKWENFPNLHCPRRHENDLKDWLRRRSAGLDHRTCHGKSGAPRHRSVGTAPGTCHAGLCGYRARSALRSVAWTSISSVLARRGKLSGSSSSCW